MTDVRYLPTDVVIPDDAPLIGGLEPVYQHGVPTPVDFIPSREALIEHYSKPPDGRIGFVMSETAYKLKLEHAQREALAHARTQGHLREMKQVIREQNQRIEQLQAAKKPPAVPLSDKLLEDLRLGEISFQEFDDQFPAALAAESAAAVVRSVMKDGWLAPRAGHTSGTLLGWTLLWIGFCILLWLLLLAIL